MSTEDPSHLIAQFALGIRMHVALTVLTAIGLLAWLTRRQLPLGMGLGLLVAAVSGTALVLGTAGATQATLHTRLGYVLTGLAVAWYVISRRLAPGRPHRDAATSRSASRPPAESASRPVLVWAAAVCGLAAAALCGITISPWTDRLAAHQAVVVPALLAVAVASLLLVLATILVHWSQRRRLWLADPHSLTDSPPRHFLLYGGVVVAGIVVGVAGVLLSAAALVPLVLLVTALAVLTVGHRRRSGAIGELGMVLLGLAITTAGAAWILPGWGGALLGCALAGVYFRWLASFWDQQLLDGRPWTTAGRLIPVTRRLAWIAATACAGLALAGTFELTPTNNAVWRPCISMLLCLLLARGLLRDSDAQGNAVAAAGAVLALLAAAVPARQVIAELAGTDVAPITLLAAAGLLVALRTALRPVQTPFVAVLNAGVAGALPAAALLALALFGIDAQTVTAAILGATAALLTLVGRSRLSAARRHL